MKTIVYYIICRKNNKRFVGTCKANNLDSRLDNLIKWSNPNIDAKRLSARTTLHSDVEKYSKEFFMVSSLKEFDSSKEASDYRDYCIQQFKSDHAEFGYNLSFQERYAH